MSEHEPKTPFFKRIKHQAWIKIENLSDNLLRKMLGSSILDRDFPDPKPPLSGEHAYIRANLESAEIIKNADIKTKEDALRVGMNSIICSYQDWKYRSLIHNLTSDKAFKIAEDFGASREEIEEAIRKAKISGATLGSRDL